MEITLCMRVMDAMASQLEAQKERIELAEARIKDLERGCSCKTWREHTGTPRPLVRGLDESFMDMHE